MRIWSRTNKYMNTKQSVWTTEGLNIKCRVFPKAPNVKLQRAAEPLGPRLCGWEEMENVHWDVQREWQSSHCWTCPQWTTGITWSYQRWCCRSLNNPSVAAVTLAALPSILFKSVSFQRKPHWLQLSAHPYLAVAWESRANLMIAYLHDLIQEKYNPDV